MNFSLKPIEHPRVPTSKVMRIGSGNPDVRFVPPSSLRQVDHDGFPGPPHLPKAAQRLSPRPGTGKTATDCRDRRDPETVKDHQQVLDLRDACQIEGAVGDVVDRTIFRPRGTRVKSAPAPTG